ncbi:hypothetical protein ABB37_02119 [Leptomonas pyrrhocoris]|uniref:Uncharacterized protein n=1 Tax=Leptomonas pyrrhocoris TaxID=157538 RepID=A0A0N0DYC3_LEPPY|nr:hypothetical protein ABB37_02119 [Leptomonas pyrrhocoris]KPA83975.1 hypothetical protein ABB37_02119 [Leptomonas pyrrhocoris]|eukprot:XP_015662414.1 hypothetical protein ABB37_02119 [Leptomonas pyrrhocoris]
MWESLPPVVSPSATPADELTGVSVATNLTGIMGGSGPEAGPRAYVLSPPPPLSRNAGNNSGRLRGTTSAPAMPVVIPELTASPTAATIAAVRTANSNPFATPREVSLTSFNAGGGGHDLSARSSLNGALPAAPPFPHPGSLLPLSFSAATAEGSRGNSVTTAATIANTPIDSAGGRPAVRDSLVTPLSSSTALPPAAQTHALFPFSVQHAVSCPPSSSQMPSTSHLSSSAAAGGRPQHLSEVSPLPPSPATSHVSSALHHATASNDDTVPAALTRGASPRYPRASEDPLAQAASPQNMSEVNASWRSPGSITLNSARSTKDASSLYFSPTTAEYAGDARNVCGGGGSGSSGFAGRGDSFTSSSSAAAAAGRYSSHSHNAPIAAATAAVGPRLMPLPGDAGALASAASFPRPPQVTFPPMLYAEARPGMAPAPASITNAAPAGAAAANFAPSSRAAPASTRSSFLATPSPSASAAAAAGEVRCSNNTTTASGVSLTFASPAFEAVGGAAHVEFVSMLRNVGAMPVGLAAATQPHNSSPLGPAISFSPPPRHTVQGLPPSPSTVPAGANNIGRAGTLPEPTSSTSTSAAAIVLASQASQSAAARPPLERGGSGSVRAVRAASSSATSPPPPPPPPPAASPASPASTTSATSRDTHHRYAVPLGASGRGMGWGGEAVAPAPRMPTPNTTAAAAAAGHTPPFSSSSSHVAYASPFTTTPDAEVAGDHHVNAGAAHPHIIPPPPHARFPPQQNMQLSFTQMGGSSSSNAFRRAIDTPTDGFDAQQDGSVDHNQSFYFGTTGNDNLRRSFFFPPTAHPSKGERDDGAEQHAGDGAAGPGFEHSAHLRHPEPLVPPRVSSVSRPSVSAAATTRSTTQSADAAPIETTDGDEHYCSPAQYCVEAFPSGSPSQQQQSQFIPPQLLLQHTSKRGEQSFSPGSSSQLQRSWDEEPPRSTATEGWGGGGGGASASGRLSLVAPRASFSTASHHTRTSPVVGGSSSNNLKGNVGTRAGSSADSPHSGTINASFISPTLANSMVQHRFEDSTASASGTSFSLPEGSTYMSGRVAAAAAATKGTNLTISPRASASAFPVSSSASLPCTAQKVAPVPAYILDWERSLIAFQHRAESYYTFKNLCTETYLTLIEHDVDRFLVCYYSGGAVRPEEAVLEALATRAGTPAGVSSRVLSSTAGNGAQGGGPAKSGSTNTTLHKFREAGSKWLKNFKRAALAPVPVWGDPKTPSSSVGSVTPLRGGRSLASSVSSTAGNSRAPTQPPQPSLTLDATAQSATAGSDEWWMITDVAASAGENVNTNSIASGEPTYAAGMQPVSKDAGGVYCAPNIETTSTDVAPLLDRQLSSSGKSFTTTSTLSDALSNTSSAGGVAGSASQKLPRSRLSYNIAAEEELRCLRQLGPYVANVIEETYMDVRPSEQVLQHVRRNYPIILNALRHVLMMSGIDPAPPSDTPTRQARYAASLSGSSAVAEAANMLIASRIRQGLLLPSIQATWRDYLSPLEMKVKELVLIATTNIDPILYELQSVPMDGITTAEMSASTLADLEARQRLCVLREQPVRRLARLLRGDEEYLASIHTMDDEFVENGAAWRWRSEAMRSAGAALSDYVPVYGLVLSRLHRLEMEHRTVLELWCRGSEAAFA